MGIPTRLIFEDSSGSLQPIDDHLWKRLMECRQKFEVESAFESQGSANRCPLDEENIGCNWSLEQIEERAAGVGVDINDQCIAKNEKFWVYYHDDCILLYELVTGIVEVFNVEGRFGCEDISSANCGRSQYGPLFLAVGLNNGNIYILNQSNRNYTQINCIDVCYDCPIKSIWLGFLPFHLIISYVAKYGIVITNTRTGQSSYIEVLPDFIKNTATSATIAFPSITVFSKTKIWFTPDIWHTSQTPFIEVYFALNPEEHLQNAQLLSTTTPSLLIETNQRFASTSNYISSQNNYSNNYNWYRNTHTIVYKTLWNSLAKSYNKIVHYKNFLLICDHHIYDTSLTIYEYSRFSNDWLYLGYIDMQTKFNIFQIRNVSITKFGTVIVQTQQAHINHFQLKCN